MEITLKLLKRLGACEDALEFFEKNKLERFDSDWIKDIPTGIKLNGYVEWLRCRFRDTCKVVQDNDKNQLTFKSSSGLSWTKTYDNNNNEIAFESSSELSWTKKTYDENNNVLTYRCSSGYSWTKTYDENNNELTYKDSLWILTG
jgi:hypothetical protein